MAKKVKGKKAKGFGKVKSQPKKKTKRPDKQQSKIRILSPDEADRAFNVPSFGEQEKRISTILGLDEDGDLPGVDDETLAIYRNYLEQHLELPFTVTGKDDFSWEEGFLVGFGSKAEHNRLRETQPSSLDTYDFLVFEVKGYFYGLMASVQRVEDRKIFVLPLAKLEATDQNSKNYQLLDDYLFWFFNWR